MSYQQKKVPSSLSDLGVSGDLLVNKGNIDCSANPNYPAATAGDTYIVSVAGKIGGGSGTDVDIKDMIVCKTTAIAGTQAAVGSSWFVLDGDDDLTAQVYGNLVNSATNKATPVDADYVGIMDSAAGNIMKKLSWANIKATLKTYFDTLYAAALGADDNYVTDAEKTVIGNTSGTNTGDQNLSGYQTTANKDATGGYAGLTLFKLNLKNVANTFTNFFTNATTAARTWTMPDKDGTVAMLDDVGGEWTYVSKLTFSNSSTQQDFTSLAAHDYYRLVFNTYNHGARLTLNVGVNGITGTAYLYFYMALTPYVNNNQAAWKIYDTGATADDVFTGDYVIGAKYLTASNMKSIAGVGSGGNGNATILNSGRITGNAADVSSIEIKPTNAISGTVELWYKDNQ